MRVLLAIDINDEDRAISDATLDDIADGLAARLSEFYPEGTYPVRARVVPGAVAEVTEGWQTLLGAWRVGIESAEETRESEEAEIALLRFEGNA